MARLLQRHGNSLALVFDKTMMEALHITRDTPVELTFHGNTLVVAPAYTGVSDEELDSAIAALRPRYKKMLEHLAE